MTETDICTTKQKLGSKRCRSRTLPAEALETMIVAQLRTLAHDPAQWHKQWWLSIAKSASWWHPYSNQRLIHALLADQDGEARTLHVTGPYTGSSSVLEFGTHPEFSPEVKFAGCAIASSPCTLSFRAGWPERWQRPVLRPRRAQRRST